MVLFLDFDGVLHPSDVYIRNGGEPFLSSDLPGARLFQHADLLADILAPRNDVQIVLSTNWVYRLGFDKALAYLPELLQSKVIGGTFEGELRLGGWRSASRGWINRTRFKQIYDYTDRHQIAREDWIAIDDDADGWGSFYAGNLIHCADDELGISDPDVERDLRALFGK